MTQQELFDAWARYMQRRDMTADMDLVFILATSFIEGSILHADVDTDAILANNGELYLHAGLQELANIAHDGETKMRAVNDYNTALGNYMMRRSLDRGKARMTTDEYRIWEAENGA